jgi:hypothetical protein
MLGCLASSAILLSLVLKQIRRNHSHLITSNEHCSEAMAR